MDAATATEQHQAFLDEVGEDIVIRRYSGQTPSRTYIDTTTRARVTGYSPAELVGSIVQGDRKIIAMAGPLASILPLTTSDKVVLRGGRDLAILGIDDSTRRIGGTLVALELQVRG